MPYLCHWRNIKNLFWLSYWKVSWIMRNNLQQNFQFLPQVVYLENICLFNRFCLGMGLGSIQCGLSIFIEYLICTKYFSRHFIPIISLNPHGNLKRRIVVFPFLKMKLLKLSLPTQLINCLHFPWKMYIRTSDKWLHWSLMSNHLYSSMLPYFCFNHE